MFLFRSTGFRLIAHRVRGQGFLLSFFSLGSLFLLSACFQSGSPQKAQESSKTDREITAFFEKSFQLMLDRHPEYQTYLGVKRVYDRLDDLTESLSN